jgi:glycine/D-amino acid oxidase-like deaminating enzyme
MSLREGTSVWQANDFPQITALPLETDATCDVVVLGAGITGALIAHRLVQCGFDTLVIDKRELAAGSTAASTGLLQYEIDTPLVDLIAKVGERHAVHAYARGRAAIDEIEQLTQELPDNCGFSRRESLYFATHFWHARRLRNEFECRKLHGFDVDFLDRNQLAACSTIRAAAAIRSRGDAQIDPYRFTQSLLKQAQSKGVRLHPKTEARDIRERAEHVQVVTARGVITARRIVYAAGYDSYRYLPTSFGSLHSTYAVASEPLESFDGWPAGSLIWETARPYFYARQTDDGRAIVGGGDTSFSTDHRREHLVERKLTRLKRRFEQLFPALELKPAFAWSGVFGESKDGLAYIGQVRNRPRAYFAVGYGGNGITFSMIAARLIADLGVGRSNPDAETFRFDR